MKGGELAPSTVLGVLVMIIILVIASFLIMPVGGFDITKFFQIKLPGSPGEIEIGEKTPGQILLGQTNEVPRICNISDPNQCMSKIEHQPSELGCAIANAIFGDFRTKGLDGDRSGVFPDVIDNCGLGTDDTEVMDNACLVDAKFFTLNDTVTSPPSKWITWTKDNGCNYCDQTFFDEVCINYNLDDRKVGAAEFCNKTISVGTETIRWVNSECVGGSGRGSWNDAAWNDNCDGYWQGWPSNRFEKCDNDNDDYCDNGPGWACDGMDRLRWLVEPSTGGYFIKDTIFGATHNNEEKLRRHQKYVYGLIWIPHGDDNFKRYHLYFEPVPEGGGENTWDFITNIFKDNNYTRYNPVGNVVPEARMIAQITVTGAPNINENELRDNLENELDADVDIITHFIGCPDLNSCATTFPESCEHCDRAPGGWDVIWDQYFKKKDINFITNVGENGLLNSSKAYRVTIYNWGGMSYSPFPGTWEFCLLRYDRAISIYEIPPPKLVGDVNEDCVVDNKDILECQKKNWLCDWNYNGLVDPDDILTVGLNFGATC